MIIFKLYSPEESIGGEDEPKKKLEAPKDYKALNPIQRKNWNDFLDYLQKEGVGGSKDLDKRDQTIGLSYLNKYNKENPDKAIDPKQISHIQYEQYMLRKGDSFPGLKPEELNYIRKGLNPAYLNRDVSETDSWLGSRTSREYYPTSHRGTNTGDQYEFGTDFESYVRSIGDSSLAEKYKVKNQISPTVEKSPSEEGQKPDSKKKDSEPKLGADLTHDPIVKHIKEFYSEYMHSQNYKKRLEGMGYKKPDATIKEREDQLKKTGVVNYPGWINGSEFIPSIPRIMYDSDQAKEIGLNKETVLAHEFSHDVGAIGVGPKEKNINPLTLNKNELKALSDKNKYNKMDLLGISDVPTLINMVHDSTAKELKADIDTIRYMLKKDKIYDTGTQEFNENILKKAKQKYKGNLIMERLGSRLDDKGFIYLMNSIADLENQHSSEA